MTTVSLPLRDLAVRAFDKLEHGSDEVTHEARLVGKLVVGETCGALRVAGRVFHPAQKQ